MIRFNKTPVIVDHVPCFVEQDNYTESFGYQWNRFSKTQIDRDRDCDGSTASEQRLFGETGWTPADLSGASILEAGSGAGRFTRPLLLRTNATIYSFDFSSAVYANYTTNGQDGGDRLTIFRASIYDIPFDDDSFDYVLCLGVLQHTPDFEKSVAALIAKAKPGGQIVVDFYAVRGWWTKIHAKYALRPLTKKLSHERLLAIIDKNAGWMMRAYAGMTKIGLRKLTRFLPIVDVDGSFPKDIPEKDLREWVVLDTFDMLSPEHDHPQKIQDVAKMFEKHGATVTFAGNVDAGSGTAAVVRGVKR